MIISMITAMTPDYVIGINNQLPWHLPADLAHFKAITSGKPIIMGRKTYDSIGRPLPKRQNIVISRHAIIEHPDVLVVRSPQEALAATEQAPEIMIIGGAQLYESWLSRAHRLYITWVQAKIKGDTFFPTFGNEWAKVSSQKHEADEKNRYHYQFDLYERV